MVSGGKGQLGTLGRSWTLLCLKWITNKDLLHSTWNSSQCYMPVWMGGGLGENGWCVCVSLCWGFGGECVCVCVCVSLCCSPDTTKGGWEVSLGENGCVCVCVPLLFTWHYKGSVCVHVCESLCCSPDTTKGVCACVCVCLSPFAVHLTLQQYC